MVWEDKALSYDDIREIGMRYDERIAEWVDMAYQNEDISALDLDEPSSIGYTLRALAAALWCYWHADSFVGGLLAVVNEGGDADTNAAVACSILGAKFGYASIPQHYVDNLLKRTMYHQKVISFIEKIGL